ncbi:MAG TPA: hypothetical protein VJH21_01330 [Candidatus Paceibacterota bacterium]
MRSLLLFILWVSIIFAGLHFLALQYALYWLLSWFDILMHFLGGFLVGLITIFALWYTKNILHVDIIVTGRRTLILTLSITFTVGVAWELFEYIFNLRDAVHYVIDTMIDLTMDLLGAIAVYWAIVHSRMRSMLE